MAFLRIPPKSIAPFVNFAQTIASGGSAVPGWFYVGGMPALLVQGVTTVAGLLQISVAFANDSSGTTQVSSYTLDAGAVLTAGASNMAWLIPVDGPWCHISVVSQAAFAPNPVPLTFTVNQLPYAVKFGSPLFVYTENVSYRDLLTAQLAGLNPNAGVTTSADALPFVGRARVAVTSAKGPWQLQAQTYLANGSMSPLGIWSDQDFANVAAASFEVMLFGLTRWDFFNPYTAAQAMSAAITPLPLE